MLRDIDDHGSRGSLGSVDVVENMRMICKSFGVGLDEYRDRDFLFGIGGAGKGVYWVEFRVCLYGV